MNQQIQQYEPQFWQGVISFVITLAVLAIVVSQAIKVVKEVIRG